MSEYFFGLHNGHLTIRANQIAKRHGAWHVNFTEPGTGQRRGWFACRNRGNPLDEQIAEKVMQSIDAAGGIYGLLHERDR